MSIINIINNIKRLESLNTNSLELVSGIYGNTTDIFCLNDLIITNLNTTIYKLLKKNGYNRIIFLDRDLNIFSFDKVSIISLYEKNVKKEELLEGPLGKIDFLNKPIFERNNINQVFVDFIPDLLNDNIKTALIFDQIEDFDSTIIRKIEEKVSKIPYKTKIESKCFFIFKNEKLEKVDSFIKKNHLDSLFHNDDENPTNLISISNPSSHEVFNLINHLRITSQIEIDISLIDTFSKILSEQKYKLKIYSNKLLKNKTINLETIKLWQKENFVKNNSNNIFEMLEI